jgi:ABC-type polysaccharide/polyol phosphate export permease
MNRVLTLARFNISMIVAERMGLVLSWALFALQFGIFGSLMSQLVQSSKVPNYFLFYGVGLMIITVFDSASFVGRRFVERAHEGELPYYLSLPVSRRGFLESQAIYGVMATLLRAGPPLIGVLAFTGQLTLSGAFFALVALTTLGLGISGIMISFSFIAFKSIDIYNAMIAGLSAVLVRFSTVFYPLIFIPSFYSPIAIFSPLTYGSDLTRWVLGIDSNLLLNPILAAVVVVGVALGTLTLSAGIVDKIIEGVKAA